MSIAFDAKTLGAATSPSSSSTTFSHTVSGADRFLAVAGVTYNFSTSTPNPTATYNGVSMTVVAQNVFVFSANNWRAHQFYLPNPSTGVNNVVITAASGTGILRGLAASYTGVDQSSPVIASNTAGTGSGNTMQISLTTAQTAWWFISGSNVDASWVAGANTSTIREATGTIGAADSGGDIAATTGNAQMSHGGTRGYGGVAMAFIPVSAVSSNIKSIQSVAQASIKSMAGVANASIKSVAGVANS